MARIDALLHPVIEGEAADPPASPEPGQCWLVTATAMGESTGREGQLAPWDGNQRTFCALNQGMELLNT